MMFLQCSQIKNLMFLTSLKMISMIYMPGLHTCLLLDRRIAGSPDRRIAGLPDCTALQPPSQLLYLFGILKLYPNTPQSQAFFDNFLKIPCRMINSSIYSSSGSHPEIRFSQFILPSTAKLTELSCHNSSQLYSAAFSSSFVSHLQSVYQPFHILTD